MIASMIFLLLKLFAMVSIGTCIKSTIKMSLNDYSCNIKIILDDNKGKEGIVNIQLPPDIVAVRCTDNYSPGYLYVSIFPVVAEIKHEIGGTTSCQLVTTRNRGVSVRNTQCTVTLIYDPTLRKLINTPIASYTPVEEKPTVFAVEPSPMSNINPKWMVVGAAVVASGVTCVFIFVVLIVRKHCRRKTSNLENNEVIEKQKILDRPAIKLPTEITYDYVYDHRIGLGTFGKMPIPVTKTGQHFR